jgi:hypothetical protein
MTSNGAKALNPMAGSALQSVEFHPLPTADRHLRQIVVIAAYLRGCAATGDSPLIVPEQS